MDTAALIEGVLAGQRRALARLLSAVEAGEEATVRAVIAAIHPHTGRAHTIGVTGSPGVGKSTLTGQLVGALRRRGRSVGVLAVDPSSPFSGGALLGDRVRMADQVLDDGVYIRSMATRGQLGGLSWASPQAIAVMDAAGFDVIVVETVGVGQAEVEIASLADTTIVAIAPGMGDAVQAAKAGILEIADIYVVNKADREGADRTVRELEGMLQMTSDDPDGWRAPILQTTADRGEGIVAVVDALDAHLVWAERSGARAIQRRRTARMQVREIVVADVRRRIGDVDAGSLLDDVLDDVVARRTDPYAAADSLIARLGDATP